MPSAAPDAVEVERFRHGLTSALAAAGRATAPDDLVLGVAVSGGPDSLALLLLAEAALPGRVCAATVDHGLRTESAAEARVVADICRSRGVPHAILPAGPLDGRGGGLQAAARARRYALLSRWCLAHDLAVLATGHHADDQAETVLMRLARGSGPAGLSGIRRGRGILDDKGAPMGVSLIRPLLDFGRSELAAIVEAAGLVAADDPSNASLDYDRTHARRLLADTPWLDARRIAGVAKHMTAADEALRWATDKAIDAHVTFVPGRQTALLDPAGLPDTILRRVVLRLLDRAEDYAENVDPITHRDGPDLTRLIARVTAGTTSTLGHVQVLGGPRWTFRPLDRPRRA